MDLILEIENAVRKVVREEIKNLSNQSQPEWVRSHEAMEIMGCSDVVLWTRATKEKSIRTKKVSPKKTLYYREDCLKRKEDKTYRPPL